MKPPQPLWIGLMIAVALGVAAFGQIGMGGMGSVPGTNSFRGYNDHEMDHNLVLPQVAVGEHYTTNMVLFNPGDPNRMEWTSAQNLRTTGKIHFYQQDGKPLSVAINNASPASNFSFSLEPSQTLYLDLVSTGADTSGWALIEVDDSSIGDDWGRMDGHEIRRAQRIMATVFYTLKDGGKTLSKVGVIPSMYEMERFLTTLLAVQSSDDLSTGVAIVNTNKKSVSVELRLRDSKGKTASTKTLSLAAGNQTARFIHELFGNSVTGNFQGVLEVVTSEEGVVTLGLLMSQNVITSIPVQHFGQWNSMMQP